ncbi:MAG: aspartate kinase [Acidobacteria bacterium]|nr:aspartate kinase [Acidobacteriota bacterium]
MADAGCVGRVADIVLRKIASGYRIVVVVSARARQTDGFIDEARSFTPDPSPREMDMLLSSGERISAALLSIALNSRGCPALALSGSQAGIITDDNHTNARIIEIRPFRVHQALDEGFVPVVGGFQGVSFKKEITTLGRGGSDVTAVALASALEAEICEIYSDVNGVFTADPRLVENAARLGEISYQEMQELGEAGARVLHPGSVEFAKTNNTVIHAKCTMEPDGAGTFIKDLEGRIKPRVVGIAHEEKVILLQVDTDSGEGMQSLSALAAFFEQKGLRTKQISFHPGLHNALCGSLVIPEKENYQIASVLSQLGGLVEPRVRIMRNLSAVSIIGSGISDRYGFLMDSLTLLANLNAAMAGLHTSSFRITFLIDRTRMREVVRSFHRHFIEMPTQKA